MKFRPCIDIHNGQVKQIVGGSLCDEGNQVEENFVSKQDAAFYAAIYRTYQLKGGHIILLNKAGTKEYNEDKEQARLALREYPGGLQIGGGISSENAVEFLKMGASHVIVTSYVFQGGMLYYERLKKLMKIVGKDKLVLDLSCRKKEDSYYVVTNRWQKFTNLKVNEESLELLSSYCSEFLIHAVDVEGKASGIEEPLVELIGKWGKVPVTYAGGISSYEDLEILKQKGRSNLDFTIGSALDLFGGTLKFEIIAK